MHRLLNKLLHTGFGLARSVFDSLLNAYILIFNVMLKSLDIQIVNFRCKGSHQYFIISIVTSFILYYNVFWLYLYVYGRPGYPTRLQNNYLLINIFSAVSEKSDRCRRRPPWPPQISYYLCYNHANAGNEYLKQICPVVYN